VTQRLAANGAACHRDRYTSSESSRVEATSLGAHASRRTIIVAPLASDTRSPHPHLRRLAEARDANLQDRVADAITGFAGSMWFVYLHISLFGWWVLTQGYPLFNDPFPFGLLTMVVSLEAIFLSAFVMLSQNRADERRRVLADHQWQLVQAEERQNEELLRISTQILELTRQVHTLTTAVHQAVVPRR
jgi:uncharacterized membrane protein